MQQEIKNTTTEEDLNYAFYKEYYQNHKKLLKNLIKSFISKCPREVLIQVLKEKKLIQRDWLQNGEKYIERYNEEKPKTLIKLQQEVKNGRTEK